MCVFCLFEQKNIHYVGHMNDDVSRILHTNVYDICIEYITISDPIGVVYVCV